jgi:hypothetical protein
MLLGQELGLGLAEAHRAAAPAALHPVHEVDPDADQHEEGQPEREHAEEARLLLRLRLDPHVIGKKRLGGVGIRGSNRGVGPVGRGELHPLAVERRGQNRSVLDLPDEVGIRHRALAHLRLAAREKVEQRQDQQEQDDPECDVSRVAQGEVSSKTAAATEGRALCQR